MSDLTHAIVGCGSIGTRHLGNLLKLGHSRIVGVDKAPERRREVTQRFGVEAVATLAEALHQGAQVVWVTLPNVLHLEVIREAVAAGCHLMVEKPLATESAAVAPLLEQAEHRGLVGFMGSNFKFHPSFPA